MILYIDGAYTISAKYENTKLIEKVEENVSIVLNGNSIDEVYDNIIKDLFHIVTKNNNGIGEQIIINTKISKLRQEISNLKIKRDKEIQFNKKVIFNNKINALEKEIKEILSN